MSLLSWLGLGPISAKDDTRCLCPSQESIAIIEKAEAAVNQLEDIKTQKVHSLAQIIITTHSQLLTLSHHRPDKVINDLLGNLVAVCSEIHDQDTVRQVLSYAGVQAVLPPLRKICADAESCLESHWTAHMVKGAGPDEVQERLKSFPYYENYEELARLELCAILSVTKHAPKRIAFIGSGPLPLTSLCLLDALNNGSLGSRPSHTHAHELNQEATVILNIDCDEAAISASLQLCLALGAPGQGMEFICTDAESPAQDLTEFDVVYMAALVGMSQTDKEDIMINIASRMRPGALMVVRSSWGLRTCLYPEVDLTTPSLLERLKPCIVVHPYGQVVNSVIVAKIRERPNCQG
ncbi:Nicotianamine synthase [Podospora didyma]|uniref:Nicotianamine synthase n=1 Tax=Podospora didyma TaxID=330526 RepID=A0AAE0N4E5_9PEZI|nr:Nicotianamine synthase [Podospora didyma]